MTYPNKKSRFGSHLVAFWQIKGVEGNTNISLACLQQAAKVVMEVLHRPELDPLALGPTQADRLTKEETSAFAIFHIVRQQVDVGKRRSSSKQQEQAEKIAIEAWLKTCRRPAHSDSPYAETLDENRATIAIDTPIPDPITTLDSFVPSNCTIGATVDEGAETYGSLAINSHSNLVSNFSEISKTENFSADDKDVSENPMPPRSSSLENRLLDKYGTETLFTPLSIGAVNKVLPSRIEVNSRIQSTGIPPDSCICVLVKPNEFTKAACSLCEKIPIVRMAQPQAMIVPNSRELKRHIKPDFAQIHQEFTQKRVTLKFLWEQYQNSRPDDRTYQYAQFCKNYQHWFATSENTPIPTGQSP